MAGLTADPFRAARLLLHLRQEGVTDGRVLNAMEAVDRSLFVDDPALAPLAFEDAVLPIPCGQVILRPSASGHLIQALALPADNAARVLLVGFGAGYMTGLLARLCGAVFALDRFAGLISDGEARLARLGIGNVSLRQGDGFVGWPDAAPFDRILLTGGVAEMPEVLLAQLAPEGRLVAPLLTATSRHIVSMTREGAASPAPFFQDVPPLIPGVAGVL